MSAGRWLETDGTRWLFDAGADCLDFTTGPDADLAGWLCTRFPRLDPAEVGERELVDARSLRDAIGRMAVAAADGDRADPDDVDTVNLFAATPDVPPALPGGRRHAGAARIRVAQALSSLARDAVAVFADTGSGRLRRCAAADCRRVFHDESRTINRRWCSMQRCGNRAKVRAYRERAGLAERDGHF
ncbi:CGNR zinc finger domain-containing protein [Lysinimonas soli]|uniref:CGNR zinc finger domain-containing protein n=1 Tax=Lysinimonas soli TaxID=1074233 RepID=A0ABW0NRQ0_9MICO